MARHVHVHLWRDAAPAGLAALYAGLAGRMAAALRDLLGRSSDARTVDDDEGHKFHGNQWVKVASGPKPQAAQAKNVKDAMYELLCSGHAFTKEEFLAIVPGLKPKKLVDYLAMLKNPKYAGPKGALQIEKNQEGLYFVALPNGQPAPAIDPALAKQAAAVDPEPLAALAPQHPHEKATQGLAPEPAPLPSPPAPAPKPDSYEEHLAQMKGAQPGSMMKVQADAHYEAAVSHAYAGLETLTQFGTNPHDAVLAFKNAKAEAMSAWAQAVHGTPFAPKPQAVYKADLQLVANIKDGMGQKAALVIWKQNTAAEKVGNFPPKPPAPVSETATHHAPQQVADMGHAVPVAPIPYETLMPAGFAGIGEADITGGKFSKGISKAKAAMADGAKDSAIGTKKSVEVMLRERLKDAPNFQALVKRLGLAKEGSGSLEARLVSQWASSSGDHHDPSVALQLAARDAFGIPDAHVEKKALGSLQAASNDEKAVIRKGIQEINSNIAPLKDHEIGTAKAALMEFVQAQYHATQDFFKSHGMNEVYLARGMTVQTDQHAADGPAALRLQPCSSFSANYTTAKSFGGSYGTVFLVRVPRQQVMSCYVTGFGCMSEHEAVVLAHKDLKAYAVPVTAAYGQVEAQAHVASQIKAGTPQQQLHAAALAATQQQKALQQHITKVLAASQPKPPVTVHVHGAPDPVAAAKKAAVNAASKASKTAALAEKFPQHYAYAAKAKTYKAEAEAAQAAYKALKGNT